MPCTIPPSQIPAPIPDPELVRLFESLLSCRFAVTIALNHRTYSIRAALPWIGDNTWIIGTGETLREAAADLRDELDLRLNAGPPATPAR